MESLKPDMPHRGFPSFPTESGALRIGAIAIGVIIAFGFLWRFVADDDQRSAFQTVQVRRGDLLVTVSATGTIEPQEVIDVGAQIAGQIDAFGKDRDGKTIDYGSVVEEGAMLAHIDDSLYRADVDQADAQVKRAKADLLQMQAKLFQAEQEWKRAQKLGPSDALSQSSYDSHRANYEIAKANIGVGEAVIVQAQAALSKVTRNLTYCTIKSPVTGVIIDRRVDIGQTVVASLNAPSLFLLAKDLKQMQLWIAVNEADIGNIHPGQAVKFTVDTFPNEVFQGTVAKVRLNATMTQNVVTYTVEVDTDNANGKLLPYLTANAKFEVSTRKDVLLVPNAALRWSPKSQDRDPSFRTRSPQRKIGLDAAWESSHEDKTLPEPAEQNGANEIHGIVWTVQGKFVRPVEVLVGGTDSIMTEVRSSELQEGSEVVFGDQQRKDAPQNRQASTNPFAPQVFHGRGRR